MTGLLYKELRQNRRILPGVVLIAVIVVFSPLVSMLLSENNSGNSFLRAAEQLNGAVGVITRLLMVFFGMILLSIMTGQLFMEDESKKWAYFTASHPKGYRGHLYMKYTVLFMVFGLYFVSLYFMDGLLQMLVFQVSGIEATSFLNLYILQFFLQLFLNAWNIPFIIRFGVKNSAYARCIALLVLALLALIYLLFGPLPGGWSGYSQLAADCLDKLMKGELTGIISVIISAFPLAAVGLYLLSYRISCKLYMKGVADYVK